MSGVPSSTEWPKQKERISWASPSKPPKIGKNRGFLWDSIPWSLPLILLPGADLRFRREFCVGPRLVARRAIVTRLKDYCSGRRAPNVQRKKIGKYFMGGQGGHF
jgi:hypothetical protein